MPEEVVRLRDVLAIRALCERYALAVDAGNAVAFVSVFTAAGHLVSNYGGNATHFNGRDELAQIVLGAKGIAPTTMHFIGNHLAEIDGDAATGVTYCIANHLRADRSNLVMMVRYLDRYARDSDGEWLIDDRSVMIDWTETRQADPADLF
jgi:SnoaL-like domain